MREILFRGKRIDNGEWLYGDLIKNLIFDGREKEIRIGDIYFEHNGDIHSSAVRKVIPDTVGQFTGLYDKNGTKIFEGDILETEGFDGTVYRDVVCFGRFNDDDNRGTEYIGFYVKSGNYTTSLLEMPLGEHNYCGVIGNIYDNPELLEDMK